MPNRLAASTSPYLRQHADNPVDWHEWGEEAFAEAVERDIPLLLSVGYSACHWCHVMAHESFEDEETAAMMNTLFVNVKVDREERPDVDSVYMDAVQATTGRGGWPMTVFLAHAGEPIFAGTYFPKVSHLGYPSFVQVLEGVSRAWTENRGTLLEVGKRIVDAISQPVPPGDMPGEDQLALAFRKIITVADPVNGGFGGDPKFPQQPVLEFLLRVGDEPWAEHARPILSTTLIAMARGGIYDQVGGGFFRYSVDGQWKIPHFEKMLYDNAQLARLYAWAWRELDDPFLRIIAEETLEYMMRDLQLPTGGFCSAQDADSEGIEGLFYLWPYFEFLEATGRDGTLAAAHFGVTPEESFENGNHLHVARPVPELAKALRLPVAEVTSAIARARQALLERRSQREPPSLDHKVIAAWNGLAIRAFAEAGATFDRPDLIEVAREAARFVLGKMTHPNGGLNRVWSEGAAKIPGFLDDHAAMAVGLFSLYAVTGEVEWFEAADRLTRIIPERFADPQGGFFTTADHSARLVTRPKDQSDNPMPSGNSLAAEALLMLSSYTGDPVALGWAEGVVRAGATMLDRYPAAGGHLASVAYSMRRRRELAIVGPDTKIFTDVAWSRFRPELAVAVNPTGYPTSIPLLAGRGTKGATTAYLCHGMVCDAPTTDPATLAL